MSKKKTAGSDEPLQDDDVLTMQEEEMEDDQETEQLTEVETLRAQVELLTEEIDELKDTMLRRQADMDNYRKRLIRDKDEAVQYANTKLIYDLLQPLDDFDRAIAVAEESKDFEKMHDGIVMIQKQIYSMLERNWGLKKIDAVGAEFNPEEHEACMMVEDENCEHETVLEDFQKGYKLHERVIRPSKVKVGKPVV